MVLGLIQRSAPESRAVRGWLPLSSPPNVSMTPVANVDAPNAVIADVTDEEGFPTGVDSDAVRLAARP